MPKLPASLSFATAAELSAHQADRELAEALRVQAMAPAELSSWLGSNWDRLQHQAQAMFTSIHRPHAAGRAWHFKNIEDKNRFDQQRETALAVSLALARQ